MKKNFRPKLLSIIALSFVLLLGSFGIQKNAKNVANADILPTLSDITLTAKDETRGGVDAEIYIMDETIPSTANIVFEYRTLESDDAEYQKFQKTFKSKWGQSKIGKIVYFKVSCPTDEEINRKLQSARNVKIKVYMPTFLLSKSNYYVAYGYSADAYSNILKDNVQIEDKNFVVVDMNLAQDGCYIALVYDGSWAIVIICIVAFLIILGVCIYLKIRKMHNSDPEYYAQLKKEKEQKKKLKKQYNNEINEYSNKSSKQNTANTNNNSNKKNKPTPKQVKRKY